MTHLCEVLAFAALASQVSMSRETTRCPVYDARSARSPLVDLNEEDRAFKKAFVSTAPATEDASTKFVSGVGVGVRHTLCAAAVESAASAWSEPQYCLRFGSRCS